MPIVSGGGGGGGGPAAGSYLPVADKTGVTVDTTTYADAIKGGGAKLTTLVFPGDQGALAIALAGDAFPRWVMAADATDGLYFSDGTADPTQTSQGLIAAIGAGFDGTKVLTAKTPSAAPQLGQVSAYKSINSGALPTVQLVSGTAVQFSALIFRDVETHTPVTFNPGVATTATCTVAISPDNSTFSTLAVVTKPVGTVFDGEIDDIVARVPISWYLKLTVVNATLGLTTYY